MIKFSTCQFCVQRNHSVKFSENQITFDPSPHIKLPLPLHLEINVYAYKWLKRIGIIVKFGSYEYLVILNHITKFYYSQSIIALGPK